jgi:2-oxo-4-hydroxy-4-carboxy-5-ureidoimidazoline decarboxylase
MLKLAEVNALDPELFTIRLRPVFEHSPWIAARTAKARPFGSREELHAALSRTVHGAREDEKLALIRAYPDPVGDAVLTNESRTEQESAGLADLSAEEIERFQDLNRRYREKFGFPFVICVRLNNKDSILQAFAKRLENSRVEEIETALGEICKIAELRLRDLIS